MDVKILKLLFYFPLHRDSLIDFIIYIIVRYLHIFPSLAGKRLLYGEYCFHDVMPCGVLYLSKHYFTLTLLLHFLDEGFK